MQFCFDRATFLHLCCFAVSCMLLQGWACALAITHLERDLVVILDNSVNISTYCSQKQIQVREAKQSNSNLVSGMEQFMDEKRFNTKSFASVSVRSGKQKADSECQFILSCDIRLREHHLNLSHKFKKELFLLIIHYYVMELTATQKQKTKEHGKNCLVSLRQKDLTQSISGRP